MAVQRVRDVIAGLVGELSQVKWWLPPVAEAQVAVLESQLALIEEGVAAAERGEAIELPESLPGVDELRERLAEARAKLAAEKFPYRVRHLPESRQAECARAIDREKRKWLADKVGREVLEAELRDALKNSSDEEVYTFALATMGYGPEYLDPDRMKTPRQLLQASIDRMRGEQRLVNDFCEPPVAGLLAEALNELERTAQTVQWYEFLHPGLDLYLTEQERTELAEQASELEPEELAQRRDDAFARHLAIELELRAKELGAERDKWAEKGREQTIADLVAWAVNRRADDMAVKAYARELVAEMIVVPTAYDPDDETEAWRDGTWVRLFRDAEEVDDLEGGAPALYIALTAAVAQRHPDQQLGAAVASAPFRRLVGQMSG